MDAITRSMLDAPPSMTLDEWARVTPEGRLFRLMRKMTEAQLEVFLQAGESLIESLPILEELHARSTQ